MENNDPAPTSSHASHEEPEVRGRPPSYDNSSESSQDFSDDLRLDDPLDPEVQRRIYIACQYDRVVLKVMRLPRVVEATWQSDENTSARLEVGDCLEMGDCLEVGDCVQVISRGGCRDGKMGYAVRSLRTGSAFKVTWNKFLRVGTREMCECLGQKCRCVYEDYEKSKEFARNASA